MPKLRVTVRQTPPAPSSPRPRQQLMQAGTRLYRTIQRPGVFCWYEDPEGGAVPPRPSRRADPTRVRSAGGRAAGAQAPRRATPQNGNSGKRAKPRRRDAPLTLDVPADAFITWLARLYQPPRRR
ncbi:MAG: hypothetical protein OHK0044_32050 [Burkholderiaceae bacterium]